jgi:hypothetical protein
MLYSESFYITIVGWVRELHGVRRVVHAHVREDKKQYAYF